MNFLRKMFGGSSMPEAAQTAVFAEKGLSAHFKKPNGESCPGIDWCVRIRESGKTVLVRTYFSTDPPNEPERQVLAERAVAAVVEKIRDGWLPHNGELVDTEQG